MLGVGEELRYLVQFNRSNSIGKGGKPLSTHEAMDALCILSPQNIDTNTHNIAVALI